MWGAHTTITFDLEQSQSVKNNPKLIRHFEVLCESDPKISIVEASRPPKGSPMGLQTFFLLLPWPNMAFSEAKHNEGILVLAWYFRKTFL